MVPITTLNYVSVKTAIEIHFGHPSECLGGMLHSELLGGYCMLLYIYDWQLVMQNHVKDDMSQHTIITRHLNKQKSKSDLNLLVLEWS